MRLGVCFYPEQWPEKRWSLEAKKMRDLGLRIVRTGEFAWNKIEPNQGDYQWNWFDSMLETFVNEGLQVVISTPVSHPPDWLIQTMGLNASNADDMNSSQVAGKKPFCFNHPLFKEFTFTLISEMAKRYGSNPAVIGWQINREPEFGQEANCACDYCVRNFQNWLQLTYGSIDHLNTAWGTPLWGNPYTSWDQVLISNQLINFRFPSYQLDLKRFRSESAIKFIKFQIDTIHSLTLHQFVTHNVDVSQNQINTFHLGKYLDHSSWSSFPTQISEKNASSLYSTNDIIPDFVYDIGDPYITGFYHSWIRGLKNAPYWVMEQQVGNATGGIVNTGIRMGAIRLWTWHAVSCGAEAVIFSRWLPPRFTYDQLSAGILRHDGTPDLGYQEISNMLPEIPILMTLDEDAISPKVALMIQYDDLWALSNQQHTIHYSYLSLVFSYYRVLTSLGVTVDITSIENNLSDYRLIILPSFYLTDPVLVARIEGYVAQGGAVLFGIRSGFKDLNNNVVEQPLPGLLSNLVGARIHSWQSLPEEVRFRIRSDISGLGGDVGTWIEAIEPEEDEGVNILARYLGGPLAGKPAFTKHPFGAGNVYYLGFYPTTDQLRSILRHLVQTEGSGNILDLPEGVVVNQRGNHRVAFNFTRTEKAFVMDDKLVTLPPRDFRYFLRDWN